MVRKGAIQTDAGKLLYAIIFRFGSIHIWIHCTATHRVMLYYTGEYCKYGEYCDAGDA